MECVDGLEGEIGDWENTKCGKKINSLKTMGNLLPLPLQRKEMSVER